MFGQEDQSEMVFAPMATQRALVSHTRDRGPLRGSRGEAARSGPFPTSEVSTTAGTRALILGPAPVTASAAIYVMNSITRDDPRSEPLSGEDLGFWWGDQPRQRTAMAMLLRLDRPPESGRLRAAAARAVEAVPRLRQRVVDAPLDLARPRWEIDPTFDLDFHVRRYALSHDDGVPGHSDLADLFRTIGPIYERPFDRTRPLWELIELDGPGDGAAIFFRLHHCVADGVGGNAILAALTDASRDEAPETARLPSPGAWSDPGIVRRFGQALAHRAGEDLDRTAALARTGWTALTRPSSWATAARVVGGLFSQASERADSPLTDFGRSRHLTGFDVPFEPLRRAKRELGGQMIDLMLSAAADAMARWHDARGYHEASDVMTLVPINLRPPSELGISALTGNRATGVMIPLPLDRQATPVDRFREIHRRMKERKANPALEHLPTFAELVAAVPRPLVRLLSLAGSQSVHLIVTNVPGIMQSRYIAGARITAGYPFAPLAPQCPVSIALYGYADRLWVGVDADGTAMPDVEHFADLLHESFDDLVAAAGASS